MARPRADARRFEHRDDRLRAAFGDDEVGSAPARPAAAAPASGRDRPARRRSPRGRWCVSRGASATQPREAEREQVAALGGDQRVQLVEDHAPQAAEQVRRASADASSSASCSGVVSRMSGGSRRWRCRLRRRRVAGARLQPDRQAHLGDRPLEVARDVDRQRLQRRDVERVEAAALAGSGRGQRRRSSTSVGRKPASVLPAPVGAISSTERPARARASSSS